MEKAFKFSKKLVESRKAQKVSLEDAHNADKWVLALAKVKNLAH